MTAISGIFVPFSPTKNTESAQRVLEERYFKKDENGTIIENDEQMMWRVANATAKPESTYSAKRSHKSMSPKSNNWSPFIDEGLVEYHASKEFKYWRDKFFEIMKNRDFLPNSPALMNAGKDNGLALSACYVLNVPDSLEGIMDTAKYQALIQKSGGGTGFSLSQLRPKDAWIRGTYGKSSGPISFLHILNEVTDKVKQGMMRRGANMGVLRVDSCDILEFINAKRATGILETLDGSRVVQYPLTNFNLSVGITDAFMKALENGTDYDLVNPHTGEIEKQESAQKVWDAIALCAYETGDPGLVFLDRVNRSRANPIPELEQIEATNPCGEQPLLNFDVCNLGSINLANFVQRFENYSHGFVEGNPESWPVITYEFDWSRFIDVVHTSVRFLDNIIDINPYPLPQIAQRAKEIRRIGLGVMGWADLLALLGIPYGSFDATNLGEKIMKVMNEEGIRASETLATERGAFPLQSQSRYKNDKPRRNSNITTVAPTGTISLLANCSSGIEPYFALAMQHKAILPDGTYRILNLTTEVFEHVAKREGFYSESLVDYMIENGTIKGHPDVPAKWQEVFKIAQEISPEDHIMMQAAWQKYNDSGISKTINLPNSATAGQIKNYYQMAYDMGTMGITVYRDGSKQIQTLNIGKKLEEKEEVAVRKVHIQGTEECPSCGEETLIHESGCDKCLNPECNYSHCTV